MAFGTNCLRRRKVLFLLFADLGYNQGNKAGAICAEKDGTIRNYNDKRTDHWNPCNVEKSEKKMKRLLKNPGILGLSHL